MKTIYPVEDRNKYKVYKHSDATKDIKVDWREFLASTESIASQTLTANNITIDSSSSSGQVSTIWVSGGDVDQNSYIDIAITTDNATPRIFKIRIHFYFEPPTSFEDSDYYY